MTDRKDFVIGIRISEQEQRKELKGTTGQSIETQYRLAKSIGESMELRLNTKLGCAFHIKRYGQPTPDSRLAAKYPGAYIDNGGKSWALSKLKRPALVMMAKDAQAGKIGAVAWAYPERMTRIPEDYKLLYRMFTKFGVTLNLGGQVMDDKSMAAMISQMVWKEDDIRSIRTKTNEALDTIRANNGKLGRTPIGLVRNEKNDGWELDAIGVLVKTKKNAGETSEQIAASLPLFRSPKSMKPRHLSTRGVERVLANIAALAAGTLEATIHNRREGWEREDCGYVRRDGTTGKIVFRCPEKNVLKWQHEQVHVDRDARDEFLGWAKDALGGAFEFE